MNFKEFIYEGVGEEHSEEDDLTLDNIKIGDRVKAISDYDGNYKIKDVNGTVRFIDKKSDIIGVEFDKNIYGHELVGNGVKHVKYEHGWNVRIKTLVRI